MALIGAIADDLTGATTCAVLLARSGARPRVFLGADSVGAGTAASADALVVSTDSRAMSPEAAYKTVRAAAEKLTACGVSYLSKRIDTTLRGNIGAETDAALDVMGDGAVAVVVPSMTKSRRIMAGGYSIIDGVPLSKTSAAADVRTPVTESRVPELLSRQTRRRVGLVELECVLRGSDAVAAELERLRDGGCEVLAADAVSADDVKNIALACVKLKWKILAVDPGEFTEQLARCRGMIGEERAAAVGEERDGGCVLAAVGSATDVTKRQIEEFCASPGSVLITVEPRRLIGAAAEAAAEVRGVSARAQALLRGADRPGAIVFATALAGERLSLDGEDDARGWSRGESSARINRGLGRIIKTVLDSERDSIAGLYCTGGDTFSAVCGELGVRCLEAVDYVIPQTDLTRMVGAYEGFPLVGKGGLMGDAGIVGRIADRIRVEAAGRRARKWKG